MPDYQLSPQQLAVICALSSGATLTAAADEAGIHRNTIANWRRNFLPFQQALAGAQYDRALLYREKIEELVDLAVQTIHGILTDPTAPPSVRLKAALAIVNLATHPPEPKKQVEIEIQNVQVEAPILQPRPVHNPAQSHPPAPTPEPPPSVHNPAQPYVRPTPKIGRNDLCPCGSGQKYKRCCLDKPLTAAA